MKKGLVIKSADSTNQDMELINSYTRSDLTPDEVYTFRVVLCDNDIDRDFERFTVESLFSLEKLFVGKTGIVDHNPSANNQMARIYKTEVESIEGKITQTNDQYFRLVASAYIPRNEENESIISKIETGILKEVSVGCSVKETTCSICGNPINSPLCSHHKGEIYNDKMCFGELSGVTDAYEWSFVAVPAQREAGVIKSFIKGEVSMENIMKSLSGEQSVTLDVNEQREIVKYVHSLEADAENGRKYRNSLMADVKRYALLGNSEISQNTMDSIVKSLSIEGLCELRDIYEKQASAVFPMKPQTYVEHKENSSENDGFTI